MNRINVSQADEYGERVHVGWFDGDRATLFAEARDFDGKNHISVNTGSQFSHEALWRTAQGRWVLEQFSDYQGTLAHYEFVGGEAARLWLIRNGEDEAAERHFGPVEEERGPGRPEVGPAFSLRLDPQLLSRVDAEADRWGLTRAAMIRELLDDALASKVE